MFVSSSSFIMSPRKLAMLSIELGAKVTGPLTDSKSPIVNHRMAATQSVAAGGGAGVERLSGSVLQLLFAGLGARGARRSTLSAWLRCGELKRPVR